ncbi:MAG TPA: SDR family NAD(P)-dependent oxidoreductase [Polyangiaceae bacterium]|jgi:NADP-dependent 3-hydroxy acid dehydrogenase YdfG
MDQPLNGRVALVTGGSSGIGEACVRAFVKAGARVVAAARRRDRLDALAQELGPACLPLALDVTDAKAVARVFEELPPPFASVCILVNGAGGALGLARAAEANLDDWDQMIAANVTGLVHVTRAALPGMIARKRGHVVNLGSVAGSFPYPGGNVYGATKAFVERFSANLRSDLLGHPIRVTNVEPGMVETEFSVVRYGGDRTKAEAVYAGMSPLVANDIADLVLFAVTRPFHVNVNRIEVMPVDQAFSPFAVHRQQS